jgi:lactate 2-monooxygenase
MDHQALHWQKEIYLNGFSGSLPDVSTDFLRLQKAAQRVMSPQAFAYVAGGAGSEESLSNNTSAFQKYKIVPRMLRDVGNRDTKIELFGTRLPAPFLLSPIGVLELVNSRADLAVARAAAQLRVPFIFSNQASVPMEECSSQMGGSSRWFQLYWSKSKALVCNFIKRAEVCGCSALVVTLDTTMLGWRTRDLDLGYLPFLEGKGIAQYTSDPVFQQFLQEVENSSAVKTRISWQAIAGLIKMVNRYPGSNFLSKLRSGRPMRAVRKFIDIYSNPSTTWDDLVFLRGQTKLPIVLKGILHADDAQLAIAAGMDGIIVSNHGARQVDGCIATIDALPKIVERVDGRIPVLVDSGVRSGADAFRALALGATAVCIGRPYVYGLAIANEKGVSAVIKNFMTDFELTMALAGCKNVAEIRKQMLYTN